MDQPQILIVAPHQGTGDLLSCMIEGDSSLKVCGVCSPTKAIAQAEKLHPDLMLLDASQPGRDWRRWVRTVKSELGCKVVVLSGQQSPFIAAQTLEAGADGFVTLDEVDLIADALRDVLRGSTYVSEAAYFTHLKVPAPPMTHDPQEPSQSYHG